MFHKDRGLDSGVERSSEQNGVNGKHCLSVLTSLTFLCSASTSKPLQKKLYNVSMEFYCKGDLLISENAGAQHPYSMMKDLQAGRD